MKSLLNFINEAQVKSSNKKFTWADAKKIVDQMEDNGHILMSINSYQHDTSSMHGDNSGNSWKYKTLEEIIENCKVPSKKCEDYLKIEFEQTSRNFARTAIGFVYKEMLNPYLDDIDAFGKIFYTINERYGYLVRWDTNHDIRLKDTHITEYDSNKKQWSNDSYANLEGKEVWRFKGERLD